MLYKEMSFDKDGKNSWAAKNFSHHAKIFAWCCKNHFLQPRKTGLLNSVLHLLLKHVSKGQTMFKLPKHETKSTLKSKLINFWTEFRSCKNRHSWRRRKFRTILLNIENLKMTLTDPINRPYSTLLLHFGPM